MYIRCTVPSVSTVMLMSDGRLPLAEMTTVAGSANERLGANERQYVTHTTYITPLQVLKFVSGREPSSTVVPRLILGGSQGRAGGGGMRSNNVTVIVTGSPSNTSLDWNWRNTSPVCWGTKVSPSKSNTLKES